jgi:G:T-mismatch repair DNA endonuclease (very short patch repair protein)
MEYRKSESIRKQNAKIENMTDEGYDHVVCKWCGMKVKRIYGIHIKNHHKDKTINDYKKEFPGSLLTCASDKEATSKNSGLHMKLDNYRLLASEKMKGENNPNHSCKTTKEERQKRSPFSLEFYKEKDVDDIESARKEFVKAALKDRITETQLEYWLERYEDDIAKKLYADRQSTFTLEKCIKKYGFVAGTEIFNNRQENWKSKVFNEYTCISRGVSNLSIEIAENINQHVKNLLSDKNEKFIYDKINKRVCKYDITHKANRKIIEVNGIFWHCKPGLYEPDYYHKVKKKTAKEIWTYDEYKIHLANAHGYDVLVVWEDDYNKDKEGTIKKCIEFLNETTN